MNRGILLCFLLMMLSAYTNAQYNLEIVISDIKNNNGKVMMQFFDENRKILTQEMRIINNNKCSFFLRNLKPGKYAIRYFHDENLNGVMETDIFGKPTEGYGFSNSVTGKFSPPPFEKWLFEIKKDKKVVLKPLY